MQYEKSSRGRQYLIRITQLCCGAIVLLLRLVLSFFILFVFCLFFVDNSINTKNKKIAIHIYKYMYAN